MLEHDIETMKDALSFSKDLLNEVERLNTKRPYHLNVIDELHINENAHSRILYKLLKFRNEKGEYEILQSFISFLKKKYYRQPNTASLDRIHIVSPEITQEEERIDLWVKEKGKYALIFENKVCGAFDQDAQLYRYIDKTRKHGFIDEQIFIFYLPQTKDNDPSDQTWGEEKEKFTSRYFKVPFREDILQWLENDILMNVRHKDYMLLTAITQYVDYLKGYFDIRNNNETKMAQQDIINNILGIKDQNKKEKVDIINSKLDELQEAINILSNYRNSISAEIDQEEIEKLKKDIEDAFDDFRYCDTCYGGVFLDLEDKHYKLYIGNDGRWYCQLELDSDDEDIENDILIQSGVRGILWLPQNYQGKCIWNYINHGNLSDAFDCMKTVIERVREYNNKTHQ